MSVEHLRLADIKGLSVISIADGARAGAVNRVYIDPQEKRIVGFSVDPGGSLLEPDSRKLIDVDDIHSIGPDAMTISDANAVRGDQTNERWMTLIDVDELMKRKVVTEGGEYVGDVASIEFEKGSYRITGIEASPGFFRSNTVIAIGDVTTIGPELVIVSDSVCAPASKDTEETADEERGWVVEERADGESGTQS